MPDKKTCPPTPPHFSKAKLLGGAKIGFMYGQVVGIMQG